MKLTREQQIEHRIVLHSARDEAFGVALRALVSGELDRVKESAITPGGGEINLLQGQATALKLILKFLTEPPTSTKQV